MLWPRRGQPVTPKSIWAFLRAVFGNARQLALENLALRQQLAIYERKRKKAKLRRCDRIF